MDQEDGLGSKKLVALRPDHLLGFCHNHLFHLILRMRADQEGGLVRARTLGRSVSHNGTSWHQRAPGRNLALNHAEFPAGGATERLPGASRSVMNSSERSAGA